MPHVASHLKSFAPKPAQAQPARQPQANDRPQGAFESMIDDNAAQAPSARDRTAAVGTPNNPPAKAKPARTSDEARPVAASAPAKAAKPANPAKDSKSAPDTQNAQDAQGSEEAKAGADLVDAAEKPATEAKTDGTTPPAAPVADAGVPPETAEPAAPPTDTILIMPEAALAVAIPVQAEPAPEAQPQPASAVAETATIAALNGEQPVVAAAAAQAKDTKAAASEDPPTKTATPSDAEQPEGKPVAQAQPNNGKAPHAALSDAENEKIARARGETADPRAGKDAPAVKTETADAPAPTSVSDMPTPQAQTQAPHASHGTTAATAAAPQTAAQAAAQPQTPVPLAGVPVEIATKAREGKTSFDIRLDPPELGRVEVRLNIDRDGNVTSRLIADRPETLDLLRRDSSGLDRALQDAGLKTSDNGMQFMLRDHAMSQHQDNGNSHADTATMVAQDDALPLHDIPVQSYGRLAGRSGGLDIRV